MHARMLALLSPLGQASPVHSSRRFHDEWVFLVCLAQVVEEAINPLHAFRIPPEERGKNTAELVSATRWLLDHVPILAGFTHRLLRSIAGAVRSATYAAGDVIRPEGGDSNFYIVIKGRVLVGGYPSTEWEARRSGALAHPPQPSLDSSTAVLTDQSATVLAEPFVLAQGGTFGSMGIITVRFGVSHVPRDVVLPLCAFVSKCSRDPYVCLRVALCTMALCSQRIGVVCTKYALAWEFLTFT